MFHRSEGNFNCFDTSSPLIPLKIVPLFALRWINALRSSIIDCRPFLLAVLFLVFWMKSRSERNVNYIFLFSVYFLKISFTSIQAHCWLRVGIFFDGFAVQINPWYLLKCLCCRVSWVVWKKSMSLNNNIYTFKHCFSFRGKKFGLNWILIPKHPETSISNNCPKAVTQCAIHGVCSFSLSQC